MSTAKIHVLKNEMPEKSYTISGNRAFLHRYADTGFRTKWCGMWAPPFKIFEYFAFKVNGEWLSPENISEFSLEKETAAHTFAACGLDVKEIAFAPKKIPAIIAQLAIKNAEKHKKEICVELEAALNMRTKSENFHTREYEAGFIEKMNAVTVKSGGNAASFGIGKLDKKISVEFLKNETYKEHYPGGELERCFIPGSYNIKFALDAGEEALLPFIFAASVSGIERIAQNHEACFHDAKYTHLLKHASHSHIHSEINTPDRELNDTYAFSASNVLGLIHESRFGKGFFAGYPWFLEFWGRDAFWSIKGLVDIGEFDAATEILKTMAQFQKERMPCLVSLDSSAKYYAADVDALFLIALDYYISQSQDTTAEKEFSQNIATSMKSLSLKNGLARHAPNETWMDSLSRDGTAVEIQSLWIEALKKRLPKTSSEMLENLGSAFWNSETKFLNDSPGSKRKTSNALVPLMFGQVEKTRGASMLNAVKNELLGPYGISTLSKNDKDFGPAKYHEGASWGLTTAIGAGAFLKYGKPDDALLCLKAMAADSRRHTLGGMSECLNSETGEILGCGMQLWSAALYIHAIDRYLFGIYLNGKKIAIEPQMPSAWKFMDRKNKRVGNDVFDMSIARIKNRCEINIHFKDEPKSPEMSACISERITSASLNSRPLIVRVFSENEISKSSVEFSAEKNIALVLRTAL